MNALIFTWETRGHASKLYVNTDEVGTRKCLGSTNLVARPTAFGDWEWEALVPYKTDVVSGRARSKDEAEKEVERVCNAK